MTFSEVTSVWGVSAVAILDRSLNVYACGRQKALPCRPTVWQQTVTTHKQPKYNHARVPAESTRCEAKMGQNNGSVKAASPRHCPATCALRNCCFSCCAGQSHKDNVRCTAVDEQLGQLEAKDVQLAQPSSTSLLMISSGQK